MSESSSESTSLTPKKDLDDYIADPFNQGLFQDLEEFEWKAIAVGFFEWFYELVALIEKGKPTAALQDLDARKYDGPFRLWIVYCLRHRFRDRLSEAWPDAPPQELPPAFHLIDSEYERLEKLFPPDMFASSTDESIHAKASSAVARGKIVSSLIVSMLQKRFMAAEERRSRELEIRQDERNKLQAELNEIVQATIAEMMPKRDPEHTLNRQVLAVGFMLKHLGVQNIDKSVQAHFVQFLTSKTFKDIYDLLRELEDRVRHRKGEDARYVINRFNELGLTTVARDIQEILNKSGL